MNRKELKSHLDKMEKKYVIKASLSNKINRIPVPGAALRKFTEYSPEKDCAMDYLYETADIMVKGIIFAKNTDSFNLSFVGGYIYECRKYMKKRRWLDAAADERFREIIARYFEPGTNENLELLLYSGLK